MYILHYPCLFLYTIPLWVRVHSWMHHLGIYKDHPVFMKCLPIPIRMDSLHQRSSNCVDSYCHLFAFSMFVNVQLDIVSAAPNLMLLDVLIISMSSCALLSISTFAVLTKLSLVEPRVLLSPLLNLKSWCQTSLWHFLCLR